MSLVSLDRTSHLTSDLYDSTIGQIVLAVILVGV
jgi:hypothetical protein